MEVDVVMGRVAMWRDSRVNVTLLPPVGKADTALFAMGEVGGGAVGVEVEVKEECEERRTEDAAMEVDRSLEDGCNG